MSLAYVLTISNPGYETNIASALLKYPCVENVHVLFGEYDLIVKVRCKNELDLKNFIISRIMKIQGVKDTRTLIVADELKK